ncbi:MAG: DUF308 domain-containing protein [Actinobacteria bacterium]|nr:DUF308 domain-containing protein [Actinomycetota bacterium]
MTQHADPMSSSPRGRRARAEIFTDASTAQSIRTAAWIPLLLGIWAVVAGIVTIVWPGGTVLALAVILGVFLVVAGPLEIAHATQIRAQAREWWLLMLRGVASLALGVLTLVWPGITVWALALIFGVELLLLGGFETAAALHARAYRHDWGWYLARGLAAIAVGIVTLAWPSITVFALALLLGFFLVYLGVMLILGATTLRRSVHVV